MCTVSWLHRPDGYQLFCNRDERRTRKPAFPPRLRESRGIRFLAPADGDFGGTWIGVNERRISLCLLNGYLEERETARPLRSRGLLVLDLMDSASLDDVAARLAGQPLDAYPAFQLLALAPARPAEFFHWDGARLRHDPSADARMPLLSSSFDPARVADSRLHRLRALRAKRAALSEEELLLAFHRSHDPRPPLPERSAYSPCMHRPDAHTVSFSRIAVAPAAIEFRYRPTAPCRTASDLSLQLVVG